MSPRTNLAIQITAVLAFSLFRFAAPGWWLLILVMTIVGVVGVLTPTVLALCTLRRPRLTWPVAVPFLTGAGCLVVAGALFPDFDDQTSYVPLLKLLGVDGDVDGLVAGIGGVAVIGFMLSVVATLVAVAVTAAPAPRGPRVVVRPPAAVR